MCLSVLISQVLPSMSILKGHIRICYFVDLPYLGNSQKGNSAVAERKKALVVYLLDISRYMAKNKHPGYDI